MTVTMNAIDTWIQHLAFVGPRPSLYGPVDGVFYGHIAVLGDLSGGTVHLHGILSAHKKTDWVYIIGAVSGAVSAESAQDILVAVSSGPLIPDGGVTVNQFVSMTAIATPGAIASNLDITGLVPMGAGAFPFGGMPVFGDPHISGDFNIISVDFEANVNLQPFRLDCWGFLVRYQSFFREVSPSLA